MLNKLSFKTVFFMLVISLAGFARAGDYQPGDNPVILSVSPNAPTDLEASVDVYTVSLSWEFTDNEGDLDYFNVYRKTYGEEFYSIIGTATGQSYTDEQVVDEVVYIYRVTAVDNEDPALESEYSDPAYATVGAATPKNFSAVGNQDEIVHLYWSTPETLPCTTLAFGTDERLGASYVFSNSSMLAKEFNAIAPVTIWKVHFGIITNTSVYWPYYPDDHHDPIEVFIVEGDGTGQPGDPAEAIADTIVTPILGEEWLTIEFYPPIICNTNDFYVGFRNTVSNYNSYEAVVVDTVIDGLEDLRHDWSWNAGGDFEPQWEEIDQSDAMWGVELNFCIKATIGIDGAPEVITGINEVFDTEDIVGYHIYRDTSPEVPVDGDHRITTDYLTETSYDDEDVENGTTYYYTAVAVYDVDGETVTSAPCEEISATPMAPGQFSISTPSAISESGESGGDIVTVPVFLANDGGLPIDYSTTTSTEYDVLSSGTGKETSEEAACVSLFGDRLYTFYSNPDGSLDDPVITTHNSNYFGYTALNSYYDENGPDFNWVDITEIGTKIDPESVIDDDDVSLGPYDMEFEFPFYDSLFSSFRVCTNGFITFNSDLTAEINQELPFSDYYDASYDSFRVAMIAPFWTDLMDPTAEYYGWFDPGDIYYYTSAESTIVSYIECSAWALDAVEIYFCQTFQVILEPSGAITYQYLSGYCNVLDYRGDGHEGDLPYAMTIGIQNSGATDGLELCHRDMEYLHNEMAIKMYRPWLRFSEPVGTIPAGGTVTIDAILDPVALDVDTYSSSLIFSASDINQSLPSQELPVSFFVEPVGIDEDNGQNALPSSFTLVQNYPNPFNAHTLIQLNLPQDDDVSLNIYDVGGRLIRSLYDGALSAGSHSIKWDGTNESGEVVSSGIYFYRLQTSAGSECKRMILLK